MRKLLLAIATISLGAAGACGDNYGAPEGGVDSATADAPVSDAAKADAPAGDGPQADAAIDAPVIDSAIDAPAIDADVDAAPDVDAADDAGTPGVDADIDAPPGVDADIDAPPGVDADIDAGAPDADVDAPSGVDAASDARIRIDAAIDAPAPEPIRVVISEIVVIPGGTQTTELIELFNPGTSPVDVHGTVLTNRAGVSARLRAPSDRDGSRNVAVTIPAKGFAWGVPNPIADVAPPEGVSFVYGDRGTGFDFADTAETVRLRMPDGIAEIDDVDMASIASSGTAVLTATSFAAVPGRSTQVDPDSLTAIGNDTPARWCVTFRAATTKGAANQDCDVAVINEVFIKPAGEQEGHAFIELAGPGGSTVVGGARILDTEGANPNPGSVNGSVTLRAGLRIPVDGILVVADGDEGETAVANFDVIADDANLEDDGGDGVQLITAGGALLDALGYEFGDAVIMQRIANNGLPIVEGTAAVYPLDGVTLGRNLTSADSNDNSADFRIDPTPTPGLPNDGAALRLDAIDPPSTPANNMPVTATLRGNDFAAGLSLKVGTGGVRACTGITPTQATCVVPGRGTPGEVDAVITNDPRRGGGSSRVKFRYTTPLAPSNVNVWEMLGL